MQITEKLIEQCLTELRQNKAKFSLYKEYYEGNHDIIENCPMQDARSNMKVVCNFPRVFINEEISYTLSNPINYISIEDDAELINTIDLNFSTWSKVHDIQLLKQALIFGKSYEVQYINQDGDFRCGVYTPLEMMVLEDDTPDKNVILALHLFEMAYDEMEYLDVYVGNKIIHYKIDNGLKQIGEDSHIFGSVPISICRANME